MKSIKAEALPDLGKLNRGEKTVILACLLIRSRSFLLFSMYILLGEEFFSFLAEFAGKEIRVPPRKILKKYLSYAEIHALCKDRDLEDPVALAEIAQKAHIRKHQVKPIYRRVDKVLSYFTLFLQREFRTEPWEVPEKVEATAEKGESPMGQATEAPVEPQPINPVGT